MILGFELRKKIPTEQP